MRSHSFIANSVFVQETREMGRGVYTKSALKKNMIIEISPVIVMPPKDRKLLDQTVLHDYIFEWGEDKQECCMALGYIPIYNHSYRSNCEYEMHFAKKTITIKTVRAIEAGEELFINYNGTWNDGKKLWFDAR